VPGTDLEDSFFLSTTEWGTGFLGCGLSWKYVFYVLTVLPWVDGVVNSADTYVYSTSV
jgi:hypothetical protein